MARTSLDVLVVGGGVVGAGIALDAATRGLSVALVEAGDYGSGTSSRSSKLIHGGLRYLEMFDFALVREALAERALLARTIAPHLVQPVQFLLPLTGSPLGSTYMHAGVALYDAFAGRRNQMRQGRRKLSKAKALASFPSLDNSKIQGALRFADGQVDDSRFVVELVRTALSRGALAASRARVHSLIVENGTVKGAQVVDETNGKRLNVNARCVVNATGVASDSVGAMVEAVGSRVRASKGVHITVERDRIRGDSAIITRTKTSVLFIIPWQDVWLLGTTDTVYEGTGEPYASTADVAYLLEQANGVLGKHLDMNDVLSVFAGLRPLIDTGAPTTAKLSRRHLVALDKPGLVSVMGGKYTTYRVMAADTTDVVCEQLGLNLSCETQSTALIGALGRQADSTLERRYGNSAAVAEQLKATRRDLDRSITGAPDLSAAEVVYMVRVEGAMSLADVLERRSHIAFTRADNGVAAAADVAKLMADELGWPKDRTASELEMYRARWAQFRSHAGLAPIPDSVPVMAEDEKRKEGIESVDTESGEKQPATPRDAEKSKTEAEILESKGDDAESS